MKPPYDSAKARFVYDSVECFLSTWNKGARDEARLGLEELSAAGFLKDPVEGKVSMYTIRTMVSHVPGRVRATKTSSMYSDQVPVPGTC